MSDDSIYKTPMAGDPASPEAHLWVDIQDLFVDWSNAERMGDADGAARIEQAFRRVALAYTALPVDTGAVSTGRKAIVRSIYARLGCVEMVNVLVMLDAVIRREETMPRQDA